VPLARLACFIFRFLKRPQDRICQEAAGQRRACQGRSQEPRRVRSYAVPLGASLGAALTYFKFRFLRRPLNEVTSLKSKIVLLLPNTVMTKKTAIF